MKPPLPRGYDCDTVNGEVLGTRLSVRDGRLALPDGMTYRLLVLPQRETMTPQVLRKIVDLVEAGATVVGPKPSRSPSLQGHPECDREVHTLADRVWGDCDGTSVRERSFGKGRVVWGKTIEEVLRADGAPPDFEFEGRRKDADLDFLHRRLGETEIYFVSNQGDRLEEARCTFRVAGRRPELWDAVTGKLRAAAAFEPTDDGRTALPLDLPPRGSLFVVFREAIPPSQRGSGTGNSTALAPVLELKGPWTVAFDPRRGAPRSVEFPELVDWTARPEEGIRFYAGTATYRKSFEGPDSPAKTAGPLYLDLGELKNLAEVRLNGTSLGVLWTKPFRAEISKALRAGPNDLEIDIVNLWPNRLIGDQRLPEDRRTTTTNVTKFKKDSPLLPSGLYGPVRILAGAAD